jgi:hypothetical protein
VAGQTLDEPSPFRGMGRSMAQLGRSGARVMVAGTLVGLAVLVVAGRMLAGGLQAGAARPTPATTAPAASTTATTAPQVPVMATIQVGAEPAAEPAA